MIKKKYRIPKLVECDKTQYVQRDLIDKVTYWMLKIIIDLGGAKNFIDKHNYFSQDYIGYFLDIGKYVDMDSDDFKKSEVIDILKEKYDRLKLKKDTFKTSKTLKKNIKQLSKLMDLNPYEEQILEFVVLLNQYDVLDETADLLGDKLNSKQAKRELSRILDIPLKAVDEAFCSTSKFSKSSIITLDKRHTNDLRHKIEIVSIEFADNMLNLDEDISVIIKDSVRPCYDSDLSLDDYTHLQKEIDILLPYLQNSFINNQQGVNILLYGLPGTGKTELVKTIANELKVDLFEISYADDEDEAIDGKKRLKAYKTAQALFANKTTLLMYDEAEDIFESGDSLFGKKRQTDKAWINRILESNNIPTIWITNNIHSIDNAIVRRFDMSIEVSIPPRSKREEIIKKYSQNLLSEKNIKLLSQNEDIAPALISRTAKVVNSIDTTNKDEAFKQLVNNTLKAQGYNEIKQNSTISLPQNYDPSFINTTTNLDDLIYGIKQTQNARICLYGVAGTGKSAYGKYIAQTLDKPVILKKVSDLQSKWVGECEQNIARAFEEAKNENAVLIFDEVDSFLQDRTNAKASWEISQVNEMLVQMENFDGIFIATTNLMDNLDSASLRRFDLKLEFKFLDTKQSWDIFKSYAKELGFDSVDKKWKQELDNLRYLTPGDFATIKRQSRFRPLRSIADMIERLQDEIKVKKVDDSRKMGFQLNSI